MQESQYDVGILLRRVNNFLLYSILGWSLDSNMLSDLGDDYNSDFVIDPTEVDRRKANIKVYKAPGPNDIPNWFLRDFSQLLSHPLAAVLTHLLEMDSSVKFGSQHYCHMWSQFLSPISTLLLQPKMILDRYLSSQQELKFLKAL